MTPTPNHPPQIKDLKMKILQIEVSNYRLIKALMLELDGQNLAVAGNTGQGKTTAISLLWEALKTVGDPVTHGEKKGQIRITLGDGETEVFVTRSFTAKTAPITIVTSKGKSISAGAFADWFCGLGQNPHKIMDMGPKEQAQSLLEAVKLPDGVDLDELDTRRATAATERLDLKRDGERDAKALGDEPEKAERVDISELLQQQNDAAESNAKRTGCIGAISNTESALEILKATAAQKAKELEQAENAVDEQIELLNQLSATLSTIAPAIDMSGLQQSIQDGSAANTKADRWDAWNEKNQALEKLRADYKAKDNEVKELDQAKKDALAASVWPLDGLSVEDGTIIFNGSPLQQCGNSEQMLVCGALAAETISQHKLHVVRMDGIESMSPEDFKQLAKIFNDKGIQVLSSRVTRGDVDDGELLIVDGEIKEQE
jgi:hypothetical protein